MHQPTKWFLFGTIVGLSLGFILKNSIEFTLCSVSEPMCINNLTHIGNALFYGMGALAVVFFVLWLVPQAYDAWRKFAIWFVPLAALLFIFYRNPGSGDLFSPYPETVFTWVSGLYILISLLIIFTARKK